MLLKDCVVFLAALSLDILVWPWRGLAQTYSGVMILMKSELQWWEDSGVGVCGCMCVWVCVGG